MKVNWADFRISLYNLKGYYINKYDYFTSKTFEWLEEHAYFQSQSKDRSELSIYLAIVGYYLKKHLSETIAFLSLFIAMLPYISSFIRRLFDLIKLLINSSKIL